MVTQSATEPNQEICIKPPPAPGIIVMILGLSLLIFAYIWPESTILSINNHLDGLPLGAGFVRIITVLFGSFFLALGFGILTLGVNSLIIGPKGFYFRNIPYFLNRRIYHWTDIRDLAVSSLPYVGSCVTFNLTREYYSKYPSEEGKKQNLLIKADRTMGVAGHDANKILALLESSKAKFTSSSGTKQFESRDSVQANSETIHTKLVRAPTAFPAMQNLMFYFWVAGLLFGCLGTAILYLSSQQEIKIFGGRMLFMGTFLWILAFSNWYILRRLKTTKIQLNFAKAIIACSVCSITFLSFGYFFHPSLYYLGMYLVIPSIVAMRIVVWLP